METDPTTDRSNRANFLACCGLLAAFVAMLTTLTVPADSAFVLKFETGSLPEGFDLGGAQAAVILSLVFAVSALALMGAGVVVRTTWVSGMIALLGALAAPWYGLVAMVSLQLAFG
jgi:hypothetical protein